MSTVPKGNHGSMYKGQHPVAMFKAAVSPAEQAGFYFFNSPGWFPSYCLEISRTFLEVRHEEHCPTLRADRAKGGTPGDATPLRETSRPPRLVAGGDGEVADVGSAARRLVPDLEARDEAEDVRRSETAACAVNREHGLPADIIEINVLHDGPPP